MIKTTMVLVFCALASSCQENGVDTRAYYPLKIVGNFSTVKAPLFIGAVESSIVLFNNIETYLIDVGMKGNLSFGTNQQDLISVGSDYRFAYIFQHGAYYNFSKRDRSVYLFKSSDLVKWDIMNHGNPVLSEQDGTIYHQIWNVGVAVDNLNTWHLFAECSQNDNDTAGIAHSTATMNGEDIEFDTNKESSHLISLAGAPWAQFILGKGIVLVYGKLNNDWEVRAGTYIGSTFTESSNFNISLPGIHVTDPHLLENDGITMTVSYDQFSIYKLKSNMTMSQFFDSL